jgi:hypothetical protein
MRTLAGCSLLAVLCIVAPAATPDFGPNVFLFNPSMPSTAIQAKIDRVFAAQKNAQFGPARYAFLFTPGEYTVDVPVGYYTQVLGLGATPDSVRIRGDVRSDATLPNNNATCAFWKAVEGFSVTPAGGTMQWAVSQATGFRRMHILGNVVLHQKGGWASGGWMSDALIDGNVDSGSQQQWISRNSEWKSWTGQNWNMVFVGVPNPPPGEWPNPAYTKIAQVPIVREKPFLAVDKAGRYTVNVPALRSNSSGITWHRGATPGKTIPIGEFYIARPDTDSAKTINAQLAKGMHVIFTPGIYDIAETIRVTKPNTVVMGLGYATLRPTNGVTALSIADVDGVILAGLLFDAGAESSPVLLEVGPAGSKARHAKDPTSLHDVFFRVGGAGVGRASVSLKIDSNDVIVDHTWIWRADHGSGVGWTNNTGANGLIVNGNDVTVYGLFVEHYQAYQVLWNGERGRVYFYQSEIPYDPPDQSSYTSGPGVNGWASYKVADNVTTHEAWGLGIYSVFRQKSVTLSRAIETPRKPGVKFHSMITCRLGNNGEITKIIDDAGGTAVGNVRPKLTKYPE